MEQNNGWVSVEDRLPEYGKETLWYHPNGTYLIDFLIEGDDNEHILGGYNADSQMVFSPVTHWMPLPEPPIK